MHRLRSRRAWGRDLLAAPMLEVRVLGLGLKAFYSNRSHSDKGEAHTSKSSNQGTWASGLGLGLFKVVCHLPR